jgi:hypothetical protein
MDAEAEEERASIRAGCAFAAGMDIVYGQSRVSEGMVFLPRYTVERLAAIRRALEGDPTWGELRASLPDDVLEEVRERAGDGLADAYLESDVAVADIPADTRVGRVQGFDDREWPRIPDVEAAHWLPEELIEEFGELRPGGLYEDQAHIIRGEDLAEALRAAGARCERNDDLIAGAY